jgi:hypothetical protein
MRLKALGTVVLLMILGSLQPSRAQTIQTQNTSQFELPSSPLFRPSSLDLSSPSTIPAKSTPIEKEPWWKPSEVHILAAVTAVTSLGCTGIKYRAQRVEKQLKDKILKVQKQTKDKILEVEQETRDKILKVELREPTLLGDKVKRNSIVILGLGGCGKTTLISHLSKDPTAAPDISTRDYCRFSWRDRNSGTESDHVYYVADHQGQNIGTLIKGLIEEQKKPYSPMTWGAINSLIFIVDVAKAPGRGNKRATELQQEVRESLRDRIQENVKQWSPTALDMIFGFTTQDSLKYVCLFVNKMDLLLPEEKEEAEKLYQGLIEDLDVRCPGLALEIIFGSVLSGDGFPKLAASLKKNSCSGHS